MLQKIEHRNGFTLIELLVVISIIGVLSTVAMTSLNGVRMKARDTKRLSEIKALSLAVQSYYYANGGYPATATTSSGDWPALYKTQMAPYYPDNPPLDPINTGSYYYRSYRVTTAPNASCNGHYAVYVYLEGLNTNPSTTCGYNSHYYFIVLDEF